MASVSPRLMMLGPVPGAQGEIAEVVQAYRAQGLFERWAIEYLATHGDAGLRRDAALAFSALRQLVTGVVRERGLMVHVHVNTDGAFWREATFMLLALAARTPYLVHLHGAGFARLQGGGRVARALVGFVLEQAACVLVSCESMRNAVRGVARRAHIEQLPSPVDVAAPAPQAPRANLVLFLGRLEAANGVFDLLEAVAALRAAVPDVRLVCAGEGDRAAAMRHAQRLGIADAVKFMSRVGAPGKRALLESAAAFALPAYHEALPPALLEAMAAGVPPVVAPVGGVPEVVVDGVSGLFAAPGDVATLQRHLRKLLIDRKLGARLGAAARESVRRRYAPERAVKQLGALYAELGLAACAAPPARAAL